MEDPSGRFPAGERVLFFAGPGGVAQDRTFAEMTSVPSGNLESLPGEIADEIARGLPVAYLSAFLALRQAGFRAGQSVLAPGAGEASGTRPQGRPCARSVAAGVNGRKPGERGRCRCRWRTARGRHRQPPAREPRRRAGPARSRRRQHRHDALGGPLTGQAVGGLARGGRVVVMGYAAGTETTMRVTDLVWKLAQVSGSRCSPPQPTSRQRRTPRSCH